jgi:hypothetical protein
MATGTSEITKEETIVKAKKAKASANKNKNKNKPKPAAKSTTIKEMVRVNINVEKTLYEKIKKFGVKHEISVTKIVNEALKQYIKK